MKSKHLIRKYSVILALAVLFAACTREQHEEEELVYSISIGTFANGSVLANKATAAAGETITLTVTPDDDYELDDITAYKTGELATAVSLNDTGSSLFFDMPEHDVTVAAVFKELPPNPPEEPEGVITMTTQASEVRIGVIFPLSVGNDNFTIDWGDGKKSNLDNASNRGSSSLPYDSYGFDHIYSDASEHRITIIGDNFYAFSCSGIPLTSLDVSSYPELIFLYCSNTQLTALDVSNNTDLYYLSCSTNQLTDLALNDLFRTLPNKAAEGITGYIYI